MKRADARPSGFNQRGPGSRRAASRRILAGAVLAGVLAGCSVFSPATTIEPYDPSDGVNVDLENGVKLRNFLVVATEKGGVGAVVGSLVNDGDRSVTVELTAQFGESTQPSVTRISVPANGLVLVAPGEQQEMSIPDIPVAPGENIEMSATAASAGTDWFDTPVLPAEGEYATLTAAPTTEPPTPSGSPTGSPTESSTESPTETATGESTDEATTTP